MPKKVRSGGGGGSLCVAYGCSKRQKKISTESYERSDSDGSSDEESIVKRWHPRTFHRFPANESMKRRWIKCIGRKDWAPTSSSVVCSDHFSESDIYRHGQKTSLRENAVPTRFLNFPKHMRPKAPNKRQVALIAVATVPEKKREFKAPTPTAEIVLQDHSYCAGISPQRVLQLQRRRVEEMKRKLHAARMRAHRLEKKVKSQDQVIASLKDAV